MQFRAIAAFAVATASVVSVSTADVTRLTAAPTATGGVSLAQPRPNLRNASGDTVGTDIVVFNATDGAILTDWPGLSTVGGGTAFATNALTTDSIEITSTQSDLGGGLYEYRFTYRNVSSTTSLLTEFTPGGSVGIGGNPASPIAQHQIAIGGFNALNDNVDSVLGAPVSLVDINGAASGEGITTLLFGDGTSIDLGFFTFIDGTGVDGQVFVSAGGADLGDFDIVGYNVRFQVQYVPAPAAMALLGVGGVIASRRRR